MIRCNNSKIDVDYVVKALFLNTVQFISRLYDENSGNCCALKNKTVNVGK